MRKKREEGRKKRSYRGKFSSQKVQHNINKKNKKREHVEDYPVVPGINTVRLLQIFHKARFPLALEEIIKLLKLPHSMKQSLQSLLKLLQKKSFLTYLRDGRWSISKQQELTGTFSVQRSGATFVILDQKNMYKIQSDIFIPQKYRNGAWHGDKVSLVVNSYVQNGKSPEGKVIQILERTLKEIVVYFDKSASGEVYLCSSVDYRLDAVFAVDISLLDVIPQRGDLLLVTPGIELKKGLFSAVARKVLGSEQDVYTQERLVKYIHKIPFSFSNDILEEGKIIKTAFADFVQTYIEDEVTPYSKISHVSTSIRQDLRSINFVTIDGEDSRDFDDAICVYEQDNGWELWVAIADVGHFVAVNSLIDKEALDRANSYYFPTSVSPMLPEALSNEICSLQPDTVRMVMATKICFDKKGIVKDAIFFPGIISSWARLTYKQVHLSLASKNSLNFSSDIYSMITHANTLAQILKKFRMDRGSLEFDIPEAYFLIEKDTGVLEKITHREHFLSHSLIEECMLAANEATARFLTEKGIHFLYRIHPKPDHERLEKLFRVLATTELAVKLPKKLDAEALKGFILQAEDTPAAFLISRMALRSMMQAKYSSELGEHFGLASPCYCHFTSPIRRYADLVVHRALKYALDEKSGYEYATQQLQQIADQCNTRERIAQDAEREIVKRLGCIFLHGHEGTVFKVIVTSITDFGFFVELVDAPIEGIVRLTSLKNDWFEYDQDRQELLGVRTGLRFYLGQELEVILVSVSLLHLEIVFNTIEKNTVANNIHERKRSKGRNKRKLLQVRRKKPSNSIA